jgi:hypothetical protein
MYASPDRDRHPAPLNGRAIESGLGCASFVICAAQQQAQLHQRDRHCTESRSTARIAASLHELRQAY